MKKVSVFVIGLLVLISCKKETSEDKSNLKSMEKDYKKVLHKEV